MFWKKKETINAQGEKLSGPKDIPELVGRHMVVEGGQNPDYVWALKGVIREVGKKEFYCRVFDESKAAKAGVQVKDWTSLDGHPELILWEGYFNKETSQAKLEKYQPRSTN